MSNGTTRPACPDPEPAGGLSVPDPQPPTLDHEGPTGEPPAPCLRQFGDYELLAEIARGGMGVIYKARQKSLRRIVALKMILAGHLASPEQVRRFQIEAEQAGNLGHPNIVPIYHVGEEQGQHYFTMKLIEGGNLGNQVLRFRNAPRAAAQVVATVARTIHYAHQRGILHRDLKPSNILLDADEQPHVTDFGLAKHLDSGEGDTRSGTILGTPGYMAPEQAAARKDLSTAVDVYSLGAILYHLLSGRPPFEAATPFDTLLKVMEKEPVPPRTFNPRVDRDLEIICLTCLAKEPERRYASAEALAEDLERYLAGEPIRARPVGTGERVLKWVRRRPAAAALLVVSALALVSLALSGAWYTVHLQAARREADEQRQRAQERGVEADRQRRLAQDNFQKRLEFVDDILINMDDRLAKGGAPAGLRLEFLNEALQLGQGLLQEQRSNPAARRQTSRVYRCIGDLYRNNFAEADKAYGQALQLQQSLVGEFPDNPLYRNDLALIHAQRAKLLQDFHRLEEAEKAYRTAIALQDQVAAKVPIQPAYQERAARYHFELANLLEEAGQRREAEEGYRQVLEMQEKLAARFPKQPTYSHDLGLTADSLASLLGDTKPEETQRWLKRALSAQQKAHKGAPLVDAYSQDLRESYVDSAAFLKRRGDHAGLAELADTLPSDFPDNGVDLYNACCFAANACQVVRENSQLRADERQRLIVKYGEKAIELLDRSIKAGYHERAHMDRDHDLDPLRDRPAFQKLLTDLDKRFPVLARTPAREYEALVREYETDLKAYQSLAGNAQRWAEKLKPRPASRISSNSLTVSWTWPRKITNPQSSWMRWSGS
jgi:tRNA A-37 threonylcarbamoyl transferase component Bud32/tetratricopeptide (TPR) repeat protein